MANEVLLKALSQPLLMVLNDAGNMDQTELLNLLRKLFPYASIQELNGDSFGFAAGDQKKMMPFLTVMTSDAPDGASNLSRAGVYRLNFALDPKQYRKRFGNLSRCWNRRMHGR